MPSWSRFLAFCPHIDVEQIGPEKAEHVEADFIAAELLGQADGFYHQSNVFCIDNSQVDPDRLGYRSGYLAPIWLMPTSPPTRGDIVIQFRDPADDEIVGSLDRPAENKAATANASGCRRNCRECGNFRHLTLAPVGIGQFALSDRRIVAFGHMDGAGQLAEARNKTINAPPWLSHCLR